MDVQMTLDSILLFAGQVVVGYVRTANIILLDDVLPRRLRTAIGQIKVLDVVVLQTGILLGRVAEGFCTRSAPCSPDIQEHELALIWF